MVISGTQEHGAGHALDANRHRTLDDLIQAEAGTQANEVGTLDVLDVFDACVVLARAGAVGAEPRESGPHIIARHELFRPVNLRHHGVPLSLWPA
ncbi:hypothetical protein AB0C86_36770 [Streptomyces lavendulae]|uniref:hypothetical protein n=1 Tax=Streptomyces lavendulae TaxID=1914 RepID=UPI0033E9B930